jgi:hypothetical protein
MTPDEMEALKRSRRGRNIALGLVLLFFVVLFYAIAWAKIAG